MTAVGSGDNLSHLVETHRNRVNPICEIFVNDSEIRCQYVYVHAGNINGLLSPVGGPPLYYAVLNNDSRLVRLLLRNGADINLRDYYGNSPLMMSCIQSYTFDSNEIFHLLLENGAGVNTSNSHGITALHVARYHSMVMELLERGADVNARDNNGRTPLDEHLDRSTLCKSNPIVTELLHWGAEIQKRNEKAVFLLVQDEVCGMELIRRVFERTGFTDSRDRLMRTPLHYAVRTGRAELVGVLLDCGASVGARSFRGYTPLHSAMDSVGDVEVVSELIRKGAEVNAESNAGATPLFLAYESVNKAVMKLLLSEGADPDLKYLVPSSSNPCTPFLLKHSVLRNYASRRQYVKSPPWRENFVISTQCISEIEAMRGTRLSKDLTLYDVAFDDKWDISCARKVYESMSSGKFPMYSELALPTLARNVRKHLSDHTNNNSLFVQGLSRKSSFRTNQHVLLEIVKYLSDDDCLNLYIAGC